MIANFYYMIAKKLHMIEVKLYNDSQVTEILEGARVYNEVGIEMIHTP